MEQVLDRAGMAAGLFGALVCLVAGVVRLGGSYTLVGFDLATVFNVGVGLMVAACLAKLHVLDHSRHEGKRNPPGA